MAKPKKDFIQRAKEKRGTELPPSANGERIVKKLEDQTLRLHQQKLDEWDRFIREERPGATVHDLEALKHFVYLLTVSIDGTKKLEAYRDRSKLLESIHSSLLREEQQRIA